MQTMALHSPVIAAHNNFMSTLESAFSESLRIEDDKKSEHALEGNLNCDVAEQNTCGVLKQQDVELNPKCLKKCVSFPDPDMTLPPSSSDDEDEKANTSSTEPLSKHSAHQTFSRSISLPLVSAMKGSREKHGGSQMKMTVKWAPDVYDPVPTLLSHTVKNRKQQKSRNKKNDKKNGKKGQKGTSSRGGGGGKDLCYKLPDSRDKVIEASTEFDALDVGSQDSYCGTSFLKSSVTKIHYSVAEAL
ncbi:BRI1-KD interacting protein [Senna tora]|uniref:BRI1-KD interacting protein n=1 Tax=Senna tora TaxID=362788 RepID=A0A834SJE5_9FABA|nr:BRI1-KD interacting protein [Senna tora]